MSYLRSFIGSKQDMARVLKIERMIRDLTNINAIREIEQFMGENRELIARNSEGANASNRDSKNREYYAVFREITGTEDTNVY